MKTYEIPEALEITSSFTQLVGRPRYPLQVRYRYLSKLLSGKYLNHGSILAHSLNLVINQINKKRDAIHFTKDGRSLNLHISRGAYFGQAIAKDYVHKMRLHKPRPHGEPWGYFTTPIIYLYDQELVWQDVNERKVTLYDKQIPTYDHIPNYFCPGAYEFRYHDRKNLPAPTYILIGQSVVPLRINMREFMHTYLSRVRKIYPSTTIVHAPHITILNAGKGKTNGNQNTPLSVFRFLEILEHLENNEYEHARRK